MYTSRANLIKLLELLHNASVLPLAIDRTSMMSAIFTLLGSGWDSKVNIYCSWIHI